MDLFRPAVLEPEPLGVLPRTIDGRPGLRVGETEISALCAKEVREPGPLVDDMAAAGQPRLAGDLGPVLTPASVSLIEPTDLEKALAPHEEARADRGHHVDELALCFRVALPFFVVLEMEIA